MKSIHDWNDFYRFGINVLTGESCGLGMRLLCDVDENGWKLLDEFFGNTHSRNADNPDSGNGVNDDAPTSGSILLPRSIFEELAVFCLMHEDGVDAAVILPWVNGLTGGIYGMTSEEYTEWSKRRDVWYGSMDRGPREYWKSRQPGSGFRNTNMAWGFTET